MNDKILKIKKESVRDIESASDIRELDLVKSKIFGKKGSITGILKKLKDLSDKEKRQLGSAVHKTKTEIEAEIEARKSHLKRASLSEQLIQSQPLDVTLPAKYMIPKGSSHPISILIQDMVNILRSVGFTVAEGPEIETEFYNFEALNTPQDHPARDMQDTFYLSPSVLLRSHTSPVQVRTMLKAKPPIQAISVGRVYRSDYDMTHTPMFHQMEGLMVDDLVSFSDLKGLMTYFIKELFGQSVQLRFRPSFFPFTEPSAEIDLKWKDDWLEVGGCGMVHPNVFKAVNYQSDDVMGFAFGMGIERIAMLRYGINDLRSFFENDLRMLEQF